jgi:xylulose-5-phosphate/fructose-6-phosphate phosphoketolase
MKTVCKNIDYHFRAANYLTCAQLFLRDNVLLRRRLKFKDLKHIVLGHWGACPAVNFLYAHFCRYIQITHSYSYLILGSGHAAPALLANLYLERSLGKVYSDLDYGTKGMHNLISKFGIDPRLQTEVSAALPGVIYAGGELGTALACAIGSLLNNPRKTSFCIVGDGEFEAGSTMASLLCKEFLFPKKDGFLILAINLNQYKMGSRSLLSTWSNKRIESFFSSFGMQPFFCKLSHDHGIKIFSSIAKMYTNWVNGIRSEIPVIILKNEKGATGPSEINDEKFAGTHRSHKVGTLKYPKPEYVSLIESWLRSYKPEELFTENGLPVREIEKNLPPKKLRIGRQLGVSYRISNEKIFARLFEKEFQKLDSSVSPMKVLGNAINRLRARNKSFILFSPDEAESNGLNVVIENNGIRGNPRWKSSVPLHFDGGVIEILNENCCHGMLQGYIQTGRDGLYVTYEAFAPITASLISQYYKFLKISNCCKWRPQIPSLKYILTSLGWHNTYTHQNPDLLNTLLSKTNGLVDVYFPCDANQVLAYFIKMLLKKNSIQVLVAGKTDFRILRTREQAYNDVQKGFWVKSYGSKKHKKRIYIIAIGDYMVKEAIDACEELSNQYRNLYIKLIAPICSKIFYDGTLKKIFRPEVAPQNVIVVCTGYSTIFKGIFGSFYDTKNWRFLGYKDGFSLNQNASVLELNEVNKESLIKYIKNQLHLSP